MSVCPRGFEDGWVFYEFSRPLDGPNTAGSFKQDLAATSGDMPGLRLRVTQGQAKGGFVYPDPQTDPKVYHQFTIQ